MRNFLVNVNGTQYQVAVEEIDASKVQAAPAAPAAAPAAPAPAAAPIVAAAPVAAPAAPAGGTPVNAPMPGNILDVKVSNGQVVKAGQILMILEAMKMENEILAPVGGTVNGVSVQKGATVDTGALLCSIH